MSAGRVDLIIDQGEDWTTQVYWTDYYNDPYPVVAPMRMSIKSYYGQTIADLQTPAEELPAGEIAPITYNTDTGWLQLHIPAETTSTMPPGNYEFDLFVNIDSGQIMVNQAAQEIYQWVRLIAGGVVVNKRITPASA